mmetsp:Transcript_8135/g.25557  ORF Transcript_8135/g.25557 Transcript_8135/m.25557 type:complete len:463 (+) Transcript_8135:3553-4941(+)
MHGPAEVVADGEEEVLDAGQLGAEVLALPPLLRVVLCLVLATGHFDCKGGHQPRDGDEESSHVGGRGPAIVIQGFGGGEKHPQRECRGGDAALCDRDVEHASILVVWDERCCASSQSDAHGSPVAERHALQLELQAGGVDVHDEGSAGELRIWQAASAGVAGGLASEEGDEHMEVGDDGSRSAEEVIRRAEGIALACVTSPCRCCRGCRCCGVHTPGSGQRREASELGDRAPSRPRGSHERAHPSAVENIVQERKRTRGVRSVGQDGGQVQRALRRHRAVLRVSQLQLGITVHLAQDGEGSVATHVGYADGYRCGGEHEAALDAAHQFTGLAQRSQHVLRRHRQRCVPDAGRSVTHDRVANRDCAGGDAGRLGQGADDDVGQRARHCGCVRVHLRRDVVPEPLIRQHRKEQTRTQGKDGQQRKGHQLDHHLARCLAARVQQRFEAAARRSRVPRRGKDARCG